VQGFFCFFESFIYVFIFLLARIATERPDERSEEDLQ